MLNKAEKTMSTNDDQDTFYLASLCECVLITADQVQEKNQLPKEIEHPLTSYSTEEEYILSDNVETKNIQKIESLQYLKENQLKSNEERKCQATTKPVLASDCNMNHNTRLVLQRIDENIENKHQKPVTRPLQLPKYDKNRILKVILHRLEDENHGYQWKNENKCFVNQMFHYAEIYHLSVLLRRLEDEYLGTYWKKKFETSLNHKGTESKSKKIVSDRTCDICGRTFKYSYLLNKHKNPYCATLQRFTCDVCGKDFKHMYQLKRHKNPYCPSSQCFICNICERPFSSNSKLSEHMIEHGMSSAQFLCEVCGVMIARKYSLENHLRIHSGEKPFICKKCGKLFYSKSSLRRHIESRHV